MKFEISEWMVLYIYIYRPKRPAWMGRLDSALNIEKLLNWYADKLIDIATDWWFGTFFIFHILGIIIPTDFHIFQRGRYTTNQANVRGRVQCIYNGWPTRVLSPKLGFDFADRGWSPPSDLSSDHYSKPHLFCHFIFVDGPCSPCWICGFHDECCGKSDLGGESDQQDSTTIETYDISTDWIWSDCHTLIMILYHDLLIEI